MLVLHDPVAGDLRRVTTALKINNELERVADLAVSIAERALALADDPRVIPIPEDLETMAGVVLAMVRDSIDAYVDAHAYLARAVITMDDEVDRRHRRIIDELKATMRARPDRLDAALHLFSAAAHLERIADHATNIAEEVIYLKEGTISGIAKGSGRGSWLRAQRAVEPFPAGRSRHGTSGPRAFITRRQPDDQHFGAAWAGAFPAMPCPHCGRGCRSVSRRPTPFEETCRDCRRPFA